MMETMRKRALVLFSFASLAYASVGLATPVDEAGSCAQALARASSASQPKRAKDYQEPWSLIRVAQDRCRDLSTPLGLRAEALLLAMRLPEYSDGRTGIGELRALVLEFDNGANCGVLKPQVLEELAGRLAASGQEHEAEDRLEDALRARQSIFGLESAEYRDGLQVSARIRAELTSRAFEADRNSVLAESEARRALERSMVLDGRDSPKALDAWMILASVLERIGKAEAAESIRDEYGERWMSTKGTEANPRQ